MSDSTLAQAAALQSLKDIPQAAMKVYGKDRRSYSDDICGDWVGNNRKTDTRQKVCCGSRCE